MIDGVFWVTACKTRSGTIVLETLPPLRTCSWGAAECQLKRCSLVIEAGVQSLP
jgi:hypothetical protein